MGWRGTGSRELPLEVWQNIYRGVPMDREATKYILQEMNKVRNPLSFLRSWIAMVDSHNATRGVSISPWTQACLDAAREILRIVLSSMEDSTVNAQRRSNYVSVGFTCLGNLDAQTHGKPRVKVGLLSRYAWFAADCLESKNTH